MLGEVGEPYWKGRTHIIDLYNDGSILLADKTKARLVRGFHSRKALELHADGVKVGTMTFDFKANLRLQGVQLVLKNAWITGIKGGKLTSTVTLEYEKIPLMPPCKKTIDMKQSIVLPGGGIRLGGEETPPAVT